MFNRRSVLNGALLSISHSLMSKASFGFSDVLAKPRMVFGYYYLATFTYQDTVDGFKKDIWVAQSLGIDGFVVAAASWSAEPIYKTRMANMFEAARQLGPGFKLFISSEVGPNGISAADVKEMVNLYRGHPNYYLDDGLPLLTSVDGKYGNGTTSAEGQDFWQNQVFTPDFKASYYPGFGLFRSPGGQVDSGNPTYAELSIAFNSWWKDTARGLFYFNTFGLPSNVVASQETYAQVMHDNGRQYMASVNGYYSRNIFSDPGDPWAWETYGGEAMAQQWASIINVQKPQWVIIVTWNDLNETYHTPALVSEMYDHYAGQHAPRHTHVGFAKLLKYFIQWYKTGKQPVPTNDQLFYFYRDHSKDLVPTNPQTAHYFNFLDDIFVTTILLTPGTVRVTSGGNVTDTPVPAGLTHIRVPFSAGSQNIKLMRGNNVLINLDGQPIVTSIANYDMNPTTGHGVY
jgi:glucan endo-1,3-alpha-glucosidase